MKYADINKRFTEIVAEYIGKGYLVNSASMTGSQGEISKIDLTNGTEIIRIMVANFTEWEPMTVDGVEIIVGRDQNEVSPHHHSTWHTLWNNKLETLSEERFYKIGETRRDRTPYYGAKEEALAAADLNFKRYRARRQSCEAKDVTSKAMEIAKRIIRREFKVQRIREADIRVIKSNGSYTVNYGRKAYTLH